MTNSPSAPDASHDVPFPEVDTYLGERIQCDEALLVTEMCNVIEQGIRKDFFHSHLAKRDVHARSTGILRAVFKVHDDLSTQFTHGIFIPGKSYDAVIRLSNASGDVSQPDTKEDGRGFAIKLLGVPGEKLLETDKQAQTQDFVMINHPIFLANMATRYLALLTKSQGSLLQKATIPFSLGWKGTKNAGILASGLIANPLQQQYYSTTPYQLGLGPGRQVVKYSIKPMSSHIDPVPKPEDPNANYLLETTKALLAKESVEYRFMLQLKKGDHMDVEDSMTEWSEIESPFIEVATITIPKQDIGGAEWNQLGESTSFNPWHSRPEHRPLGSINRSRKVVYERISRVRNELNQVPRSELTTLPIGLCPVFN